MTFRIGFTKKTTVVKLMREFTDANCPFDSPFPHLYIKVDDADAARATAIYDAHNPGALQEQELRKVATEQMAELQKALALETSLAKQNSLRREISRLRFMSQGV